MSMVVKQPRIPVVWRNVMALVALGKAIVVGTGLGIAALGFVDVVTADRIRTVVSEVTNNHAIEAFSFAGGAIGFLWKLICGVVR